MVNSHLVRVAAGVWVLPLLCLSLLALAVPDSSALPRRGVRADAATAPLCEGRVRRLRAGLLSFSFTCGGEDVTAFELQANRALHSVNDPSFAFGCERSSSRSFACDDIHSGAGSVGSGLATVSEPLCRRGAHLIIQITPSLNFEDSSRASFALKGPC